MLAWKLHSRSLESNQEILSLLNDTVLEKRRHYLTLIGTLYQFDTIFLFKIVPKNYFIFNTKFSFLTSGTYKNFKKILKLIFGTAFFVFYGLLNPFGH